MPVRKITIYVAEDGRITDTELLDDHVVTQSQLNASFILSRAVQEEEFGIPYASTEEMTAEAMKTGLPRQDTGWTLEEVCPNCALPWLRAVRLPSGASAMRCFGCESLVV